MLAARLYMLLEEVLWSKADSGRKDTGLQIFMEDSQDAENVNDANKI